MLDVKLVRKRHASYPAIFAAINKNFLPKAGIEVQKEAVRIIRNHKFKGSGHLRSSIKYKVKGDAVSIGSNLEYAPYVEYGTGIYAEGGGGRKTPWVYFDKKRKAWVTTRGMAAKPFLRPALDNKRKRLVKLWADMYEKVFKVMGA